MLRKSLRKKGMEKEIVFSEKEKKKKRKERNCLRKRN